MPTTTLRAAAAAFTAALVLAVPAAADAKSSKQVTLDASSQVRLYQQGQDVYAKAAGVRRYRLGSGIPGVSRTESSIHDAVVAGRYVAFAVGHDGPDFRADQIVVRDVVKRRFVVQTDPVVSETGFDVGDGREVLSLVLGRAGDVAWIVQYAHGTEALLRRQVVLLERGAASARLLDAEGESDTAAAIDAYSLTLNERLSDRPRLFWQHGERARSATF